MRKKKPSHFRRDILLLRHHHYHHQDDDDDNFPPTHYLTWCDNPHRVPVLIIDIPSVARHHLHSVAVVVATLPPVAVVESVPLAAVDADVRSMRTMMSDAVVVVVVPALVDRTMRTT
jgi:hypothetical protein